MNMSDEVPAAAKYPQHEKAIAAESQLLLLSEFYDWLRSEHIVLARLDTDDDCWYPCSETPEMLFARFLGIDIDAFYAEKKAALAEIRSRHDVHAG